MRIFLDDQRSAPEGWTLVRRAPEAIELLKTGRVTDISLDHDLGPTMWTGDAVLLWIENAVALDGFVPPNITIHSANPPARKRMEQGVRAIARLRASVQGASTGTAIPTDTEAAA